MQALILRLVVLALVVVLLWSIVSAARRFITSERRRVFTATPELTFPQGDHSSPARVRILAFSSDACRPCHTLQRPALEEISATHKDAVAISWIDAPTSPELTERFHVLTLPTTVVLDTQNHVHAVNYGFAPTYRLLEQ